MKNVAVFFGGTSVEHDVSVITGVLTANSIDKEKYNPIPVYVDYDGVWYGGEQLFNIDYFKNLQTEKLVRVTFIGGDNALYRIKRGKLKRIAVLSAAINCIHGERGEDGALAGLLDLCGIANASPPIFASAAAMDKCATKAVLKGIGVKTAPYAVFGQNFSAEHEEKRLGYPMIVKPARLGSSIGVSRADNRGELLKSISLAKRFGNKILIEKCFTDFIEINCACYKDLRGNLVVSPCEQPTRVDKILRFEDKYMGGDRIFPADIPDQTAKKIQSITAKVYNAFYFEGIIRIDYILSDGEIYLNEINGVPGSLAYYLFCNATKEFSELLTQLVERALYVFNSETSLARKFSSPILQIDGAKCAKRLKKN